MKASFLLENYDVFYSKIFLKLYIAPSTLLCPPPPSLYSSINVQIKHSQNHLS